MNSNNTIVLRAFNKHFFEFIDDMIRIFPDNPHIKTSRDYLETLKKANPTMLIKCWDFFILKPYAEQIEAGDLTFFFEKDYSNDVKMMPNSKEVLEIIDNTLRKPLIELDGKNKEHCLAHFQLVSKLCAKWSEGK